MVDINSLTLEQAKSYAYDEMIKIEMAQKNLAMLNQIIAKKMQEDQEKKEKLVTALSKPKKSDKS